MGIVVQNIAVPDFLKTLKAQIILHQIAAQFPLGLFVCKQTTPSAAAGHLSFTISCLHKRQHHQKTPRHLAASCKL